MSYHILQQFDEQMLAEIAAGRAGAGQETADAILRELKKQKERRSAQTSTRRGLWLVLTVSLLLAASALSLALDARHRAAELQQRYGSLEKSSGQR